MPSPSPGSTYPFATRYSLKRLMAPAAWAFELLFDNSQSETASMNVPASFCGGYGDAVIGAGVSRGIGGAVWSADLVVTDTDLDTYVQFVTNAMYSWVWGGKNMSGSLEYYFNGFGQHGGRYDPASLAANPDLLVRVLRGELFTLGRHYLSANLMIEMSPLWILTPTVFLNVEDPSALFQLVTTSGAGPV